MNFYMDINLDKQKKNLSEINYLLDIPLTIKEKYEVAIVSINFVNFWDPKLQWVEGLYFYTDIIDNKQKDIDSPDMAQICYINFKGLLKNELVYVKFDRPCYYPINKTYINRVNFLLRDQYYRKINERSDNREKYMNIKLHFRKLRK